MTEENTNIELPEGVDAKQLCFVSPEGQFRELSLVISIFGEPAVKAANIHLLSSLGCTQDKVFLDSEAADPAKAPRISQIDQGWRLIKNISLSTTFNSWSNQDEGSSGISSKALMSSDMTPGAVLVVAGLLPRHLDASPSGSLTLNFSNPMRGRR